ncbi:hypothetical protein J6590_039810 [Homalodisca vitripennis]|nr:hypothetical protein J6590_039810 [Homalodisca vitripennis]
MSEIEECLSFKDQISLSTSSFDVSQRNVKLATKRRISCERLYDLYWRCTSSTSLLSLTPQIFWRYCNRSLTSLNDLLRNRCSRPVSLSEVSRDGRSSAARACVPSICIVGIINYSITKSSSQHILVLWWKGDQIFVRHRHNRTNKHLRDLDLNTFPFEVQAMARLHRGICSRDMKLLHYQTDNRFFVKCLKISNLKEAAKIGRLCSFKTTRESVQQSTTASGDFHCSSQDQISQYKPTPETEEQKICSREAVYFNLFPPAYNGFLSAGHHLPLTAI